MAAWLNVLTFMNCWLWVMPAMICVCNQVMFCLCRWPGEMLGMVVDKIHELGTFSETDWSARTVVEIAAKKKSDGWFFHAGTGHEWLLTLKFRVARNTFKATELTSELGLIPLNEIPDLPLYGNQPRVKVKALRGPWQEVQLQVWQLEEIDRNVFWKFLARAVAGFQKITERQQQNPSELMPWKVLGRKWHLMTKGFPPGKSPAWELSLLEQLIAGLEQAAPDGEWIWTNQQLVHVKLPGSETPWATLVTKRLDAVELVLSGPPGEFALGRIATLGADRQVTPGRGDEEVLKFKFDQVEQATDAQLAELLADHRQAAEANGSAGKQGAKPRRRRRAASQAD